MTKMNTVVVAISQQRLEELERKEALLFEAEKWYQSTREHLEELELENADLRERLQIFGAGCLELPEIPPEFNMPLSYTEETAEYNANEAEHIIEEGDDNEVHNNNG